MDNNTILVFKHAGLGDAPDELLILLAKKFLTLLLEAGTLPARIIFYTNGVRLACQGSTVIPLLKELSKKGVELILCKTCLDYFKLTEKVEVGIVGGMPELIESLAQAPKVLFM
jgi:sulfur relay (sulfurtransferase) complex TusBCD TusD component (DsrE family)